MILFHLKLTESMFASGVMLFKSTLGFPHQGRMVCVVIGLCVMPKRVKSWQEPPGTSFRNPFFCCIYTCFEVFFRSL